MFTEIVFLSISKAQVKKLSKLKWKSLLYYTKHSDSNEKSEGKEEQERDIELVTWYKKIEMVGIDIKSLDRENETGRLMLKTTFLNQHFINELDKIGLQLIKISAGSIFTRGFLVLLEPKSTKILTE